jgi:hypothetical protein
MGGCWRTRTRTVSIFYWGFDDDLTLPVHPGIYGGLGTPRSPTRSTSRHIGRDGEQHWAIIRRAAGNGVRPRIRCVVVAEDNSTPTQGAAPWSGGRGRARRGYRPSRPGSPQVAAALQSLCLSARQVVGSAVQGRQPRRVALQPARGEASHPDTGEAREVPWCACPVSPWCEALDRCVIRRWHVGHGASARGQRWMKPWFR